MATNWNGPQPAPLAVWRLATVNFPQVRNLGIYVRRNIAGTATPSLHSEGRAIDLGLNVSDPTEKLIGNQLFQAFVDLGQQTGIQEVIWNRQIWSDLRPNVRAYTGANPHSDHVHVGFTRTGSQSSNLPLLALRFAIIRTGLEELSAAYRNKA